MIIAQCGCTDRLAKLVVLAFLSTAFILLETTPRNIIAVHAEVINQANATSLRGRRQLDKSIIQTLSEINGRVEHTIIDNNVRDPSVTIRVMEEEGEKEGENENENHEEEEQHNEEEEGDRQEEEGEAEQEQDHEEEEKEEQQQQEEDEQREENGNFDNNDVQYDNDSYGSETGSNFVDYIENLLDRIKTDAATIWTTSPSEWGEDLWKDFGIFSGIVASLLVLFCFICCFCCRGDKSKNIEVMTDDERTKRHVDDHTTPFVMIEDVNNNGTITSQDTPQLHTETTEGVSYSTLSPLSTHTGVKNDTQTTDRTCDTNSKIGKRSSIVPEPPKSIVGETLDVWSEFLGFKKTKYNMKSKYALTDDEATTDDEINRSKRSSNRSRRVRNRKRTSPASPRKNKYSSASLKLPINEQTSELTNTSDLLKGSAHTREGGATYADADTDTIPLSALAQDHNDTSPTLVGIGIDESKNSQNGTKFLTSSAQETPVTSDSKYPKPPRKNFLKEKSKNLLRSLGSGTKAKSNGSAASGGSTEDPKEASLLSTSGVEA